MERTLDDSANRRLVLPQAFLIDSVLILLQNVCAGMVTVKGYRQGISMMNSRLWQPKIF